jgi:hypothetical protein
LKDLDLVLGGSIVFSSRFALSLVVALSLSTLAAANSAPVTLPNFHASSSSVATGYASSSHSSGLGEKSAPMTFGHLTSYTSTNNTFLASIHGTISHKDGDWAVWRQGSPKPLATPEPGSLLLLSTGIMGLAGMVRRKLQR